MISGIGIDIVEVERIASKIGKDQGFKELVFSAAEIAYCQAAANKYEHYAARFAAKEAFFKATGTGWAEGTSFNEIEVGHDEKGKPILKFLGRTATTLEQKGIGKVFVSLSHVKTMATAMVVIEQM
ncbi:MAG: holo-ACP synthase [Chitinophagaceae bacterium]